jgi:hypothetical protein
MARRAWPDSRLGTILATLERHYGVPPQPRFSGPFEMILWEIVAYLADDERRAIAFEALRDRVGLTPDRILAASMEMLCEITRMGGAIAAEERAERLRTAARLDLSGALEMPRKRRRSC